MFRFGFVVFILTLAGGLIAQERPCPGDVTRTRDPLITVQSPQSCGSNVNTTMGGVSVSTPTNVCPLLVIVRPGYDTTVSQPGSGTFTRPVKHLPIRLLQSECEVSWLLGIIPIVISSRCVSVAWVNAGLVTHYEQHPCGEEDTKDDSEDDPNPESEGREPVRVRWEKAP